MPVFLYGFLNKIFQTEYEGRMAFACYIRVLSPEQHRNHADQYETSYHKSKCT